jgi:hypothetical protein
MRGGHVELELDDDSVRRVDHVVLGTGYGVDVNAISFLTPELRRQIRQRSGYPELNGRMESTVPNLYFSGAAAAGNFGPIMWFVHGGPWAAERISRVLTQGTNFMVPQEQAAASLEDGSRRVEQPIFNRE